MAGPLIDLALPYQRALIESPKKKKIWLSSRQAGKSWAMSFIASYKALSKPNGLSLCISTGARAANELMKKCVLMAQAVKALSDGRLTYMSSADCVKFSNGSRVLSLPSGNPAGLRGYTASAILIDECAFIERPYDVFAAIAPTLTRDKDAELVVASTPAGKEGLFWDLWNNADDEWYRQKTTVEDAVRDGLKIDVEAIRRLVADPDVFDMEYMCKFAESYSSFIDISLLDWYDELPKGPQTAYCGMDIGSAHDKTAIVSLVQIGEESYVDDIAVMTKASYESQLDVLKQLHGKRQYAAGFIDQNGIGSAVAEFATKKVTSKIKGYTWTSANKTPAYEDVRAAIFDHKLKFRRGLKGLIESDFQNVHRIVNEAGKVSFEAGRGSNGHSDAASAIVLAMQAAKQHPTSFGMPQSWTMPSPFGSWKSKL